jgi:putative transcriptional regulator
MSCHPTPEELLLKFATGTLSPAPALALHVALDPQARRAVDELNCLGGVLLESEAAAPQDDAALERVMARLDRIAVEPRATPATRRLGFEWAPPPLAPYLRPGLHWRRILGKFDEIRLDVPGDAYRAPLLRLEPGRGLPEHKHPGYEYCPSSEHLRQIGPIWKRGSGGSAD